MSTLPGGIVTFLFTDVEGSTRLAKALGDALWADLLEDHRRLLRHALTARAGQEVDTQGDAFFFVFTSASDALTAAIDAQRALEQHSWPEEGRVRVRLGLHTGEAIARGDHYVGQEVHRASRICDAGHGGQIVVSQTTAELVRERLPGEATLIDLGQHRLKDLGDPQRLFQVDAAGLPAMFPRLRSLDAPHNLPAERSSFIGRDAEIAAVRRLLAEYRLVTLTGIGGSGKTRLAIRVGTEELAGFPDGVFFVDLAPIGDPDLVAQTTATACGLSLDASGAVGGSLDEQLVGALARRTCLLLVDNCEHLLDATADLVDRLLATGPSVTVLATSREALAIEGERIVPVAPLSVPEETSDVDASEAVRLFVERATAVRPAFQLDAETRRAVVEICRRLDGIPLAIEFAAARVAHLSPRQIADRLEDMFRLLTGGRRRIQRQQTLAATLDWSHQLLDAGEQTLFRRLAVFAGGFSLEAAEAVCAGDDLPAGSVLDRLASLVAKSLLSTADDDEGEARYRLLETVRAYASEKLAAADEVETVRARHRDWYLDWLEGFPFERLAFAPAVHRRRLRERDNLRTAADWCERDDRPDLLVRLVSRMYDVGMTTTNDSRDGRRRLLDALRQEDRLSTEERVACHALHAIAGWNALEVDVPFAEATRAIDLAGGRPTSFLVMALMTRAFVTSVMGCLPGAAPQLAADARRDADAAVATARAGLPTEWLAYAELNGWMIEMNLGNARAAAAWATAGLETASAAHLTGWWRRVSLVGLAVSHHLLGEKEDALRAALRLRALPEPEAVDLPAATIYGLIDVAPALVAGGEVEMASQMLRDATHVFRRLATPLTENHLLGMFAYTEHLRGRPERAGRLLGAARYLGGAADLAIPFRTPGGWSLYRHYLPIVREALGPDEARRARDEGRAMTMDEAFAYALDGLD